MRRGEMQGNQWYVPAKRVKGRTDHIIPLPDEAMAILRAIEPPNAAPTDFVFAGGAPQTINHPAMRLLLRELGYDPQRGPNRRTVTDQLDDHVALNIARHAERIPFAFCGHTHRERQNTLEGIRGYQPSGRSALELFEREVMPRLTRSS